MDHIEITMQHSESTVRRLAKVQYDTFSGSAKLLLYAVSIVGILMGFGLIIDLGTPLRYFPMALGCLIFANIGASANLKAKKTLALIQKQGGEFPRTTMRFGSGKIQITEHGGASHAMEYSKIIRLVQDPEYFYLFVTVEAAYMVSLSQIQDVPSFKTFLEKRTGLLMQQPVKLLNFNLKNIQTMQQNQQKSQRVSQTSRSKNRLHRKK